MQHHLFAICWTNEPSRHSGHTHLEAEENRSGTLLYSQHEKITRMSKRTRFSFRCFVNLFENRLRNRSKSSTRPEVYRGTNAPKTTPPPKRYRTATIFLALREEKLQEAGLNLLIHGFGSRIRPLRAKKSKGKKKNFSNNSNFPQHPSFPTPCQIILSVAASNIFAIRNNDTVNSLLCILIA